jgi:LysM repeat protein
MPSEQPAPRRSTARPSLRDADDAFEGAVVPFSTARQRAARSAIPANDYRSERDVPEPSWEPRRNRTRRRGAVRRTRSAPQAWYQQYALPIAGAGATVVAVGLIFVLVQLFRPNGATPDPTAQGGTSTATTLATTQSSESTAPAFSNLPPPAATTGSAGNPTPTIRMAVQNLDPNYTVVAGDTLGAIATRFNTTVVRIQAMNGIEDVTALKIGQKLVIPQPFAGAR